MIDPFVCCIISGTENQNFHKMFSPFWNMYFHFKYDYLNEGIWMRKWFSLRFPFCQLFMVNADRFYDFKLFSSR